MPTTTPTGANIWWLPTEAHTVGEQAVRVILVNLENEIRLKIP